MSAPDSAPAHATLPLLAVALSLGGAGCPAPPPATPPPVQAPPAEKPREYVGSQACAPCHAAEVAAWTGSQHQQAMQEATPRTALGDFSGVQVSDHRRRARFTSQDGRLMVRTQGAGGAEADLAAAYTFGVSPLQQLLIAFPGGRYQALDLAWDSRPKPDGGQRWFNLGADQPRSPDDPLSWTGRYQRWNMQCADCHSTSVRKGYDVQTDSYQTTWSELSVGCEACHGPGSSHVAWAKAGGGGADRGLVVTLHRAALDTGAPVPTDRVARAVTQADPALSNVCAPCHARRSPLFGPVQTGAPLEDAAFPALLTQPAFYADGQQREEDYTWASFRSSRMFQAGVTCVDCHDPHTTAPRAQGDALCERCHDASRFATSGHHHHAETSEGARCVSCHAPARTYMVVDARRDHGFRVPRPDLDAATGAPDACTGCHEGRGADWAAGAMDGWYGPGWRARREHGTTLARAGEGSREAQTALLRLAQDDTAPAIIRATALRLLDGGSSEIPGAAGALSRDPDPSVRIAAIGLLEGYGGRAALLSPLLADPVRGVRLEAARLLADVPTAQLPPGRAEAMRAALDEYRAYLAQNADWPAIGVSLGDLLLRTGDGEGALAAYRRAITQDPGLVSAYVNLADALRGLGRDEDGEQALREGISASPDNADLHHALGLLLVRRKDQPGALRELAEAARLAPGNTRYTYVYAVALSSWGQPALARAALDAGLAAHPRDERLLEARRALQASP